MKLTLVRSLLLMVFLLSSVVTANETILGEWSSKSTHVSIAPGPTLTAVLANGKTKVKSGSWVVDGQIFQFATKSGHVYTVTLQKDQLTINGPNRREVFRRD